MTPCQNFLQPFNDLPSYRARWMCAWLFWRYKKGFEPHHVLQALDTGASWKRIAHATGMGLATLLGSGLMLKYVFQSSWSLFASLMFSCVFWLMIDTAQKAHELLQSDGELWARALKERKTLDALAKGIGRVLGEELDPFKVEEIITRPFPCWERQVLMLLTLPQSHAFSQSVLKAEQLTRHTSPAAPVAGRSPRRL